MRSFDGDGRVSAKECIGGFMSFIDDRGRFERTIVAPSASAFVLIDPDQDGRGAPPIADDLFRIPDLRRA